MRPSVGLVGLCLLLATAALAQDDLPDLNTVSVPDGDATKSEEQPKETEAPKTTDKPKNEDDDKKTTADAKPTASVDDFKLTGSAPPASSVPTNAPSSAQNGPSSTEEVFHLTGLPTIAGYTIPKVGVPDTAAAPYMQKSNLPDGTVFICVGAALGFFGAAILAWRGLVAWSLHRSVKRAALAQSMSDMKGAAGMPGRKKGLYNVVGANSNMSLDHLSAAPPGKSKPFATMGNTGTPPKSTSTNSLFFSPTAPGGARPESMANRSSSYLPAGYYPTGTSQPAAGSPNMQVGGQHGSHLSTHSLAQPGNRFSARSGISPPGSPSLPPSSRGYDRAPPSRDGMSMYNRNSVATNGGNRGMYGAEAGSMSQLSLNVPGGTTVPGGRAPSAYLEDLFENGAGGAGGGNGRY